MNGNATAIIFKHHKPNTLTAHSEQSNTNERALSKLTANANERAVAVNENDAQTDVVRTEQMAMQMLNQWQQTKARRDLKSEQLLCSLNSALQQCHRDDSAQRILHHHVKENKWTDFTLHECETKYFKKRVDAKKTCIQIDARCVTTDGAALLALFVSHEQTQPARNNATWQTLDPSSYVRVAINDSDHRFVTDAWYYIAIQAESATVGALHFKIRINAISQLKKAKEVTIGRGIKQRLNHRLKQIRANDAEMNAFQQRLLSIKQRQKCDVRIKPNEKVTLNRMNAADFLWNSSKITLPSSAPGIIAWDDKKDVTLLQCMPMFERIGSGKWQLLALIVAYAFVPTVTASDCNQRVAVLKRAQYCEKEEILQNAAVHRKQVIAEARLTECEQKLELLQLKDQQRMQRLEQAHKQRQLQHVQRKWIFILHTALRVAVWNRKMVEYRQRQKESRRRIHACMVIQQVVRRKLKKEREWKAFLLCNRLRTLFRVCVINGEINKYNHAANIIKHFLLETQTNSFSPISVVITNFRQSVLTIQRFTRMLYYRKACRIKVFRKQFDEYIAALIKACKGNAPKERRYKFSEAALQMTLDEFYIQRSEQHNRRMKVWLREKNKHMKSATKMNVLLAGKRMKKTVFLMRKPIFSMQFDEDELEALILKAEKFHKQQRHS